MTWQYVVEMDGSPNGKVHWLQGMSDPQAPQVPHVSCAYCGREYSNGRPEGGNCTSCGALLRLSSAPGGMTRNEKMGALDDGPYVRPPTIWPEPPKPQQCTR
jgi:hypothetical protein